MGKWIWKFGDFEIYHSLLLHNRRIEYGDKYPCVWKLYTPEPTVLFRKKLSTKGGMIHIEALGFFMTEINAGGGWGDNHKYYGAADIEVPAGENITISVRVSNTESFPALRINGAIETDESWECDDLTRNFGPVGTGDIFDAENTRPDVFPFHYEKLQYETKTEVNDGLLFDYGRETFAKISFSGLAANEDVFVSYGESMAEALDSKYSIVHLTEKADSEGRLSIRPFAFRYIWVDKKNADICAEYEYLPVEYKGSFICDDEEINTIWNTAAYTFHLNSREFFLDGIKRDRWVWSGDAYQSLFVSRYLFFDKDLEKRTLIALGGKSPFRCHINTIMDYTFLWIMGVYEYYRTYGDTAFLRNEYDQIEEIMNFCRSRISPDGFVRGQEGDWVFIDWAPMDKGGALCGEQILYARALRDYDRICSIVKADSKGALKEAETLEQLIQDEFYDGEKGVFIDCFETGKRNVSRHTNILAYLFLSCSDEQKENIYEKVICNDDVPPITTPYFKFYENQVRCLHGSGSALEDEFKSYYGAMLNTGATTLYEQFDPNESEAEHYSMYGDPYGRSLCHAWSSSPIYLLGAYRLGVVNTGIAYSTFEVRPNLGGLRWFSGKVPVPGGSVSVTLKDGKLEVTSDIPGGTLIYKGKQYKIDRTVCI